MILPVGSPVLAAPVRKIALAPPTSLPTEALNLPLPEAVGAALDTEVTAVVGTITTTESTAAHPGYLALPQRAVVGQYPTLKV
jgi:hypothetical protein